MFDIPGVFEVPLIEGTEHSKADGIIEYISTGKQFCFAKFATLYDFHSDNQLTNQIFESFTNMEIKPLFTHIKTSDVTKFITGICNFLNNPENFITKISNHLSNDEQDTNIFCHLIFPQLCFYFGTVETQKIGYNIIISSINVENKEFTKHLLAAYFDLFPEFTDAYWNELIYSLSKGKTVICSFIEAIKNSFHFLTRFHQDIIATLKEKDKDLLTSFLYSFYIPLIDNQYKNTIDDDYIQMQISELHKIFSFISNNKDCALNDLIIDSFKETTYSEYNMINYSSDINTPLYLFIINGRETNILMKFFAEENIIKFSTSVNNIEPDSFAEYCCSYIVKFDYRKLFETKSARTSNMMFSKKEKVNAECATEEEKQIINCVFSSLKDIASSNCVSLYQLLLQKQNSIISQNIKNCFNVNMSDIEERIKQKLINDAYDNEEKFNEQIACSYITAIIGEKIQSFRNGIFPLISYHFQNLAFINFSEGFKYTRKTLDISTQNEDLREYYKMNINDVNHTNNKEQFIILNEYNMSNYSNVDECLSSLPETDSQLFLQFFKGLALINAWHHSSTPQVSLGSKIQPYLIYERYRIIEKNTKITQSLCEVLQQMRAQSKYCISKKITKMMYIVDNLINTFGDNKVIEIMPNLMICSNSDDIFIPFIWYARMLIFFPHLLKGTWFKNSTTINVIKDRCFINITNYNREMISFIYDYYYNNNGTSPLST